MSSLLLGDGRVLVVAPELKRQLDAASIESASDVAQVVDGDSSPALLLIANGELAFVTTRSVRRWKPTEVKRVEATSIRLVAEPSVEFAAWGAVSERADFLRAVAALLHPPKPAAGAARAEPADVGPAASGAGVARRGGAAVRWADENGDLVVASVAAVLFVVMLALKPSPNCAGDVRLSLAFKIAAWGCGLGFPVATVCSLFARKSTGAKVATFAAGVVVSLLAVISIAGISVGPNWSPTGENRMGTTTTMESVLRGVVRNAPPGRRAYWLGATFQGAKVVDASSSGMPYAEVTYERRDKLGGFGPGTTVRTYPAGEDRLHAEQFPNAVRLHTSTGQTVVVTFGYPTTTPGAQLLEAARAAVAPIPRNVTYAGCA
jgi:hypothetical protein